MTIIRIVHIVGSMNVGGIETWLMHVLRNIDKSKFRMDFIVHDRKPGKFDEEIFNNGSVIHYCPYHKNPLKYFFNLRRIISDQYDIVHSHAHHFSGFSLFLCAIFGVKGRIAHSHNSSALDQSPGIFRNIYLKCMDLLIYLFANGGLAVSEEAAIAIFGPNWKRDRRRKIVFCGIDTKPFRVRSQDLGKSYQLEFGLGPNDVIAVHVGLFRPEKNHKFLLEIASIALLKFPEIKFLFIGDGPLFDQIKQQAEKSGLTNVIFCGVRNDVIAILLNIADIFLMPSISEGLPLSAVEAQYSRVPCLLSSAITRDVAVDRAVVRFLPLDVGPKEWASETFKFGVKKSFSSDVPIDDFFKKFDILENCKNLFEYYEALVDPPR